MSGELVLHKPAGEAEQWVAMHYQHMPSQAAINPDFVLSGTNPVLYGCNDHFDIQPKNYCAADDDFNSQGEAGSQFEVRGVLYDVKRTDVNHAGLLRIELVPAEKCVAPRDNFQSEAQMQTCGCFDLECQGDCGC